MFQIIQEQYLLLIAYLSLGYLIGSTPFGLILTSLFTDQNLKEIGSGNIGATNVLRTGKKSLAILTLLLDILKGFIPVFVISNYYDISSLCGVSMALGCFFGHIYTFWLKFKGGKGVATYLGILAAFSWGAALLFIALYIITFTLSRYSSLSSLISTVVSALSLYIFSTIEILVLFLALSIIVVYAHRGNVTRLIKGQENRFGSKQT